MKKLWIENISNLPSVLYQEETPSGDFLDKTNDIISWDKYGEIVVDYIFVLKKIRELSVLMLNPNYPTIDFSGWVNLTTELKKVISKYLLVPYNLRLQVFNDEEDLFNTKTLLTKSYGIQNANFKGRLALVEKMRNYVFINYVRKSLMSLESSKQFGADTLLLLDEFERFSTNNFYYWLNNEIGTIYEVNGFAQKSYYNETLKNELISIYNGE